MKKRKSNLRMAFTSIISLLLCISMLVGTTFAWFTDSVTSANNIIKSGNLDIDVKMADGTSIQDVTTLFNDISLWEPGAVAFENLTVENNGSLALKYQMALNFTGASTNGTGGTLADVLKVAVIPGGFNGDREQAKALGFNYSLSSFNLNGKLLPEQEFVYGIVIYWEPSAIDNQYNIPGGMSIDLGILVNATQLTSEDDSFGPDYDVNTTFPGQSESDTAAANVKANGAATVEVNSAPSVATNKTIIDAPEGSFKPTDKVDVKVDSKNTLFNITNADTGEVVASLDVTMTVNGIGTSADLSDGKVYTVTTYISKGLNVINVEYTETDKAQPTGWDYDPVTGKLVFTTSHFSNYAVFAKALAYDAVMDTGVNDLKTIVDSIKGERNDVIIPAANQGDVATEIQNSSSLSEEEKTAALEALSGVAKIGSKTYQSLEAAFAAVQDGETITLQKDIDSVDGILIDNKNINIDLNNKTYTVTKGTSTSNRNFKVIGNSVVTIKNGTMVASDDTYGTVRTEGSANVTLENLKLYNYRGGGLNVKAVTGTNVTINGCEIYSQYGGGVEASGGNIVLNNTKIDQQGVYENGWYSVAMEINSGGKITVNSGEYSGKAIATDANAVKGNCVAFILSSGGTLEINGGTFSGTVAETANASNFCGLIYADRAAVVNIYGGTFHSNGAILDMRNNAGSQPNPKATISGGTFSANPTVSGLYSSNLITVAEGCEVIENTDGTYTVAEKVQETPITTEAQLREAIAKGGKVEVAARIELTDTIVIPKGTEVELVLTNPCEITTAQKADGTYYRVFENHGKLSISGYQSRIVSAGIDNYGMLTLADIGIESKGVDTMEIRCAAVHNFKDSSFVLNSGGLYATGQTNQAVALVVDAGATVTLNGGTINHTCNSSPAIDNDGTMVIENITAKSNTGTLLRSRGSLTVNDGDFVCFSVAEGMPHYVIEATGNTTVINGGTFNGKRVAPGFIVVAKPDATVQINGGTFESAHTEALTGNGKITVTGGQFWSNINPKYIAEGYEVKKVNNINIVTKA